jgi:hypothetical protein
MNAAPDDDNVQVLLERLGILVPSDDIPFLQRALLRQRELLRGMSAQVRPETEPAHVFRTTAED